MAGRGMGAATKGGGCVEKGARNHMMSETSKKTGPVMMAKGGIVDKVKGAAKSAMEDVKRGAMLVADDVNYLVGTKRGKQVEDSINQREKERSSIDLEKEFDRARAAGYKKGGSVTKGAINQHKKMAMGKKMMGGGMVKGYKKGGMC